MRQALDGCFVFGCKPKLATVVVAAHASLDADLHGAGIADFASGRIVFYRGEAAEGKSHTVQIVRADTAETLCRINVS